MSRRDKYIVLILSLAIPILIGLHFLTGELEIGLSDLWNALFQDSNSTNTFIIREIRIPRICIAIIAGASLSLSGLFMQTLFNNPLAGPYILGINSGASLFVALGILSGIPLFYNDFGTIMSALCGAFIFGIIILIFSIFIRSYISLLLIGIMLGGFTSAFISILQSISENEALKKYILWSMGSLQKVELNQLPIIILVFILGLIGSFFLIKPLNLLVLGEKEANHLGTNIKTVRLLLIIITSVLSGLITAFCGPIAFVGLAVPNIAKIIFKTQNHRTLWITCILLGSSFMLLSDVLIQGLSNYFVLPLNAFTSILGAPFVIYIVLKKTA